MATRNKFKTDKLFYDYFSSEEECSKYLHSVLEKYSTIDCHREDCISEKRVTFLSKSGDYLCRDCRRKKSMTFGTYFYRTHHSLLEWYKVIWLFLSRKDRISAKKLHKQMGFPWYSTALDVLEKVRGLLGSTDKLKNRVEIGEITFSGRNSAFAAEKDKRGVKQIRLALINDGVTLESFCKKNIQADSILVTNDANQYNWISKKQNFQHEVFSKEVTARTSPRLITPVQTITELIKKRFKGVNSKGIKPDKLNGYLNEIAFRYNNRRKSREWQFHEIVRRAVTKGNTRDV